MAAGVGMFAIAGAKDPEARAGLVLDLEGVAHRRQLGVARPPFTEDPLRTVGAPHAAPDAALSATVEQLRSMDIVREVTSVMRVEGGDE